MDYHNKHNEILYPGLPRGQVFTLKRRFVFSGFHPIFKLETSKHEFADIIHQNRQGFEGNKLSEGGKEFVAFQQHVLQTKTNRRSARKIQTVFLPRFCLFCLVSSRILQNNFLDLYLVEIRRYKLSFFAKTATNYIARPPPYF